MKVAVPTSKWTQDAEPPFRRYSMPLNSTLLNSGKEECLSVFGSVDEIHNAAHNFTSRILHLLQVHMRNPKNPFQGSHHNFYVYIHIQYICIQAQWKWICSGFNHRGRCLHADSIPWDTLRGPEKIYFPAGSTRTTHRTLLCPIGGAANTALIGQETWLLTPAWQKVTWVGLARGKGDVDVFGFVEAEKLIVFVVVQRWELVDRSQILLLCPLWRTHDESHSRGLGCFGRLVDATDNSLR